MSAKSKSGLTQPKCYKASDLEMELRGLFHPNHSVVLPSIQFSVLESDLLAHSVGM